MEISKQELMNKINTYVHNREIIELIDGIKEEHFYGRFEYGNDIVDEVSIGIDSIN